MTAAVMLSRAVPIDPAAVSQRVADRAAEIGTDEALARVRGGDQEAWYAVNGRTGDDTVRLDIYPRVWSGSCTHYARLGIGQARHRPRACSHVVAAAIEEARVRGCEIPDPNRPAPASSDPPHDPRDVHQARILLATGEGFDRAELRRMVREFDAWKAQRRREMGDDFYGD